MHTDLKHRLIGVYGVLAALNLAAWAAALLLLDTPALWGLALLAYGLGLRHSVDADHIAAIDNVTRKLMQQGERPVAVGFFFALGHSAVVALAVLAVAAAATLVTRHFEAFRATGGLIGTGVSTLFLLAIALANLLVLGSVWRTYRRVRAGRAHVEEDLDLLLDGRGLLARLYRPLFRLIGRSWHMLPLGFLFGLGFDTASEVALLGLAASETAKGLPLAAILVFPALFAAGMSLIDTTDGVLMLGAYGWAFSNPLRKLRLNLAMTAVSVLLALSIGSLQMLDLAGSSWPAIGLLQDHSSQVGLAIVGFFGVVWLGALLLGHR